MKTKLFLFIGILMVSMMLKANEVVKIGELCYELNEADRAAILTDENVIRTSLSVDYNSVAYNFKPGLSLEIPTSVVYENKTYKVISIGDYAFFNCSGLTSVTIPNSVTSIGDYAFFNCSGLTSVTIPNSVTSIGESAFDKCSSLTSVNISDIAAWCEINFSSYHANPLSYAQKLYINGQLITNLIIPISVTSIGCYAFSGCSSLTSITIPNSVTSIGDFAFSGCSSLTSITIPNSVTSIGVSTFSNCSGLTSVTIPNSVTRIGNSAFKGCSSLTSITIPNSVTRIGEHAFYNCSGLTSVNISDIAAWCEITFCDNYANPLSYAQKLYINGQLITNLIIPISVTSIGDFAFSGCSSLTSITIPNSVTSIGVSTFSNCSGLTSVTIPNSVTRISGVAFYNCSGLTSVTIPNSVTIIGYNAFSGCNSLMSIYWDIEDIEFDKNYPFATISENISAFVFGNNVKVIPDYLCYEMNKLQSITIPNSVTSIGSNAFYGCSEVETLTLGKNIKTIGKSAFAGCKRITDIYCYAERVPDVETSSYDDSFKDVSRRAILWVPANRVRNYTTDEYWGQFDVRAMQSEDTNTDKVVVKTEDNQAGFKWPKVEGVDSYILTISDLQGNTICSLTFNADGQLQNIAFYTPARDGQNAPQQAHGTGFSFTVTGLEANTTYKYMIEAKDVTEKVIEKFEGQFTTDGGVYSGIDDISGIAPKTQPAYKIFENGQIIIIAPNGRKYSTTGVEI